MVTAYVNGWSLHQKSLVHARVGVVWVNNNPYEPQNIQLGPQSSQYAEIAGILITLQLVAAKNIKTVVVCTDSNYARLSFLLHLNAWKRNNFITSNRTPKNCFWHVTI